MVKITQVEKNSRAARVGVQAGDVLISINQNEITDVFQKGYKLGDRVLRPAMVKVAN